MHDWVILSCDPAAPERTATVLLKLLQRRCWVRLVGLQEGALQEGGATSRASAAVGAVA